VGVGIEEHFIASDALALAPVTHQVVYLEDGDIADLRRTQRDIIQGEMDELCSLKDMRAFYARAAEPKELVVIDGADHLFDGKVREVADAIEDLLGDWRG